MRKIAICAFTLILLPLFLAGNVMGRSNILSGGLSLSYDYQDRDSDGTTLTNSGDDDFERFSLTPSLQFVTSSERDKFTFSVASGIKYDNDESETDWDHDFYAAVQRSLTRAWQVNLSNRFVRSDHYTSGSALDDESSGDPELSSDLGRRRYDRNTLNFSTDYNYRPDSNMGLQFSWIALRNEESGSGFEDYDRYLGTISNTHRYTANWKSTLDLTVVRGEFDTAGVGSLSEDLYEYRPQLSIESNLIDNNPLIFSYGFIGVRYDEDLQNDSDIHKGQFKWRRDFSPRFYTIIGGGPSYEETDGQDDNWTANGIAEANYKVKRGSYRFLAEKGFESENFAGDGDRGTVDFWSAEFSFNRMLSQFLSLDGRLRYLFEERTQVVSNTTTESEEDLYLAELGLGYTFWKHYKASVNYSFTSKDSDTDLDDYDDHRVVLTLSWNQELMRW